MCHNRRDQFNDVFWYDKITPAHERTGLRSGFQGESATHTHTGFELSFGACRGENFQDKLQQAVLDKNLGRERLEPEYVHAIHYRFQDDLIVVLSRRPQDLHFTFPLPISHWPTHHIPPHLP